MKLMFVVTAECTKCGETFSTDKVLTVCTKCGGELLFQYDLTQVAEKISKRILERREDTSVSDRERNKIL
jgi:predicted  nucleic acid-binding Zn-ribbon protein